MNDLPNGWRRVALADLGDWYGGGTPSKSRSDFWISGTVPWLSPKDMGAEVLQSTQDLITESAITGSAVRRVPAGAVALVVRSGILERTLPVAVVPFAVTLNQDMKAVVPRPDVDARWIAWGLRSRERDLLRQCRKAGTTVASIETSRLLEQELLVPPLDEQRRILDVLEDHLSRIDAADSAVNAATKRAEKLTGISLLFLLRSHQGDVARTRMSFGSERVRLPSTWRISTVGAEAILVEYGTSVKTQPEGTTDGIPVLRMGNVKSGKLVWDSLKFLPRDQTDVVRLRLYAGDLLFNRTNSAELVGKSAVYTGEREATFASYLIRVRFGAEVNPHWANRIINSALGRQFIASVSSQQVGQANVNGTKLRAFPLPVPPRELQDQFVRRLDAEQDAVDRLAAQARDAHGRAAALRRALLAAAFSGRLAGDASDHDLLQELPGV